MEGGYCTNVLLHSLTNCHQELATKPCLLPKDVTTACGTVNLYFHNVSNLQKQQFVFGLCTVLKCVEGTNFSCYGWGYVLIENIKTGRICMLCLLWIQCKYLYRSKFCSATDLTFAVLQLVSHNWLSNWDDQSFQLSHW
jgi:hypothetical protein